MSEKDSKDIKVERNPKINIQEADPSLPPSEPKPAATVLLVRTIEEAVEVFMIQRSIKTNFGGAWVFPGGKLDEYDLKDDINKLFFSSPKFLTISSCTFCVAVAVSAIMGFGLIL